MSTASGRSRPGSSAFRQRPGHRQRVGRMPALALALRGPAPGVRGNRVENRARAESAASQASMSAYRAGRIVASQSARSKRGTPENT